MLNDPLGIGLFVALVLTSLTLAVLAWKMRKGVPDD